ncbi:MAG: FecR family protein [Tannerella sp.]|jgi:ferric-dicitrate binding protein FerR (iron transport regulator)|nr:FecR family protein [Tannerella sp.]
MTTEKINILTARYFSDEILPEEKEELFRAASEDDEVQRQFADMLAVKAVLNSEKLCTDAVEADNRWDEFRNLNNRRKRNTVILMVSKYAAIFIAGAALMFATLIPKNESAVQAMNSLTAPPGQRANLTLSDGTTVWLNSNSTIVYPGQFAGAEREVTLIGEAYFNVTRDEGVPFHVKTKHIDVEVFGTEFNVSDYDEQSQPEVQLVRGSVSVKSKGMKEPYLLKENQKVTFNDNRIVSVENMDEPKDKTAQITSKLVPSPVKNVLKIDNIPNKDYFLWKEGLLSFKDEKVSDIFDKLSSFYNVKIVADTAAPFMSRHYTGKFHTIDGVEQAIKVLQLEHRYTYTRDDNNVITIK